MRIRSKFKTLLLAGAALAVCACTTQSQAPAPGANPAPAGPAVAAAAKVEAPALFVVKDPDSTLYLFGSIHLLKPETKWRTAEMEAALQSAGEVWFETPIDPASQAKLAPLVQKLGLDPARPLSSKLPPEGLAKLALAATAMGADAKAFEPMRPWLAAISLALGPVMKAGYQPNAGVDQVLALETKAKTQKHFETSEQQIRFFADLPEAVETQFLLQTLEEFDRGAARIDSLAQAWVKGDYAAMERLGLEEMRTRYPALYETLLAKRNRDWAEQIDKELKGAGTDFVTVGALHLVGPDSVQTLLTQKGYVVERVAIQGAPK